MNKPEDSCSIARHCIPQKQSHQIVNQKGPREVDEVVELGLEHPSVEGEAEGRESREAFAEVVIQQQAFGATRRLKGR
jgi:hypothetical protein